MLQKKISEYITEEYTNQRTKYLIYYLSDEK